MKIDKSETPYLDLSSDEALNAIGITNIINIIINKVYENISDLNSLRLALQDVDYDSMIDIVNSVIEEENATIGKLQQMTEMLVPEAQSIEDGKDEAVELIDESLKHPSNIKRHKKALKEADQDNTHYLSYYKEFPTDAGNGIVKARAELQDYQEFPSEREAIQALEDISDDLRSQGYIKKSSILYVLPSRKVGDESYYIVEEELGAEEQVPVK